jgi:hypothetical protein
MDKRTTGIIGLVAAILLCGLPGLCGLCIGPFSAIVAMIPGAEIDILGSSEPGSAIGFGIATFCVSVVFVAIPVLVWYFTLREKPAAAEVVDYEGPLPDDM